MITDATSTAPRPGEEDLAAVLRDMSRAARRGFLYRAVPVVLTGLLSMLWLGWALPLGVMTAIAFHEFVLIPAVFRRLVAPRAPTNPRLAGAIMHASLAFGGVLYCAVWLPLLLTGSLAGMFVAASWLWGSIVHNLTYFTRTRAIFVSTCAAQISAALAAPFFMNLGALTPWFMLYVTVQTLVIVLLAAGDKQSLAEVARRDRAARELAEEANRAKSQFLTTMSHELRTPLNAIIGYAEIIEEDHEGSPATSSAEDARRVRRAAHHLLSLINEVLDLSKIEAGRLEIINGPVNVEALLHDIEETVRPIGASNGNRLALDIVGRIPMLETDGARLKQCLINLATNACKFTRDGRVTIRASVEARAGASVLEVAVVDTGVGISRENQARLFQPFVQIDGTATRTQDGTGLGLVITRKLAQAMGGDITLVSTPGLGSTFTLAIPARDPAKARVTAIAAARSRTIMLVTSAAYDRDAPELRKILGGLDPRGLAAVLGSIPNEAMERSLKLVGRELTADFLHYLEPSASERVLRALPLDSYRPAILDNAPATPRPGAHVLVIEDDLAAHDLTCRALERVFPTVQCVASGEDGLSLLASSPPALVVLDINLPDISGWTVLERIKAAPLSRHIPVLVVTIDDDRARAMALGACDHMVKPVDRDGLTAATVRYALRDDEANPAPPTVSAVARQFG